MSLRRRRRQNAREAAVRAARARLAGKNLPDTGWVATLHQVGEGLDALGQQACLACGKLLINPKTRVLNADGQPLRADGTVETGFPAGVVSTITPPPDAPAKYEEVTITGRLPHAAPCRTPGRLIT